LASECKQLIIQPAKTASFLKRTSEQKINEHCLLKQNPAGLPAGFIIVIIEMVII